jgi:hypothetical protein
MTMQAKHSEQEAAAASLRSVLLINGGFSVGSGALLAIAAQPLADAFVPGVPAVGAVPLWGIVMALGIGVVVFGLDVLHTATWARMSILAGRIVFLADVAWVVGSVALLLLTGGALSALAVELVAVFAGIVAVFAWVEHRAVRGMQGRTGTVPGGAQGTAHS